MGFHCRVFALAFEYPGASQRAALLGALDALEGAGASKEAGALRALVLKGSVEEWALAHNGLFGSAGQFPLELCFHLSDNPFEQAKRLGCIAGAYRAFGCDAPEGRRHDELPLLLDFLGALELKADHADAKGSPEQAAITRKAAADLVGETLLPGLLALGDKLHSAGAGGLFLPLLAAVHAYVLSLAQEKAAA